MKHFSKVFLMLSVAVLSFQISLLKRPAKERTVPKKIVQYRQNIFNYDHQKVVDFLLSKKSCEIVNPSKISILLTINENAKKLDSVFIQKFNSTLSFTFSNPKPFKSQCEQMSPIDLIKLDVAQVMKKTLITKNYYDLLSKKTKELDDNYKRTKKEQEEENKFIAARNDIYKNWEDVFRNRTEAIVYISKKPHYKKIVIAVIDTGYDFNHPVLKNSVPDKYLSDTKILDFANKQDATDSNGHGSHVAGIILGIMPQAYILPLKYYNPKASGQENLDATVAAINYAIDEKVDIINYSGGGPEASVEELRAFKRAEKAGIIVIAAAGNERSNIDDKKNAYFPASYNLKNIVTVGNGVLGRHTSSNYGKKTVHFLADGFRVRSTIPNNGMGYMTGTSQATPIITALYATLMAQYPDATHEDIIRHIAKNAYTGHETTNHSKFGSIRLSQTLQEPMMTTKIANRLIAGKKQ